MKNKIEDLRNHLFEALERLGDDERMKNPLALEKEVKRAKSISEVSTVLVETLKAETNHMKVLTDAGIRNVKPTDFAFLPEVSAQKQIESTQK